MIHDSFKDATTALSWQADDKLVDIWLFAAVITRKAKYRSMSLMEVSKRICHREPLFSATISNKIGKVMVHLLF